MPSAINNGMTLKVDKAGRIVLPKIVRDRLRLHAGSDLMLEESPEGILLRPVEQRASLVEKQGLLVHRGEGPAAFDWNRMIEEAREDRIKDVAGL
jgi:AbrB family looped-hinge helix DNA binding protein